MDWTTMGAWPRLQTCIIDPLSGWQPQPAPLVPVHTHYHFTPAAPILDADVERIAKRVVELLKAVP